MPICSLCRLADNGTTPLTTVDLLGCPNAKTNARVAEKSGRRLGVDAGVEVKVGPVLVGTRETVLCTERVASG